MERTSRNIQHAKEIEPRMPETASRGFNGTGSSGVTLLKARDSSMVNWGSTPSLETSGDGRKNYRRSKSD